jgi:hypothetical protein
MSLDRTGDSEPFYVISAKHVRGRILMTNLIQPAAYRAPPASPGPVRHTGRYRNGTLGLMFGRPLFSRRRASDELADDKNQLVDVRMTALLGRLPPPQPSNSGITCPCSFNEDGSTKGDVPNETVEFRSLRRL